MVLSTDNAYGQPSTSNYLLGRGILMLDFYSSDLPTKKFFDMGNATAFTITIDEETLEHQSSRAGLKKTDASVTLSKQLSGSFTLDESAAKQLASFLSGTIAETAIGAASFADPTRMKQEIPANSGGHWLEIADKDDSDKRYRNLDTGTFKVFSLTTGGTEWTAQTQVDEKLGMFFVINNAADLDDAASQDVYLEFTAPAGSNQEIQTLQQTTVRAALLFRAENAQTGKKREARLHKVKITSEGDLALIGDEFAEMTFNFIAEESSETKFSASPVGTITEFF